MKLLICTQAVDHNDPVLGFFCRWIEEFAKHCEQVMVICLREGAHALPSNVKVLSLGKERNTSRLTRVILFYKYIFSRRNKYDAVFVHMNPEYVVLGGLLWRLLGKKTVLWYTHKQVDLKLRIATFFANRILTASKESFRLKTKKLYVVGHGIDTEFFSPDPSLVRGHHWLSAGRLSKVKRHDVAIRAAASADKELRIAGDGPERANLERLVHKIGARVIFLGALNQEQLRDEYRTAALLLHTSETGSLDKVVLEALACDCPLRTNDPALKPLERESSFYVKKEHSLEQCIERILRLLC